MNTQTRTLPKQYSVVGENQQDRISNLPDELLTHILSFLPMKEAVATGILSNRWNSIWTHLPTLDLDGLHFSDLYDEAGIGEIFLKFVGNALVRRKMPYLQNVSVDGLEFDRRVIKSWISSAIERNIRSLNLSVCLNEPNILVLPQTLFSGCSLVVLKLGMNVFLNFPVASTNCFPNLKALHLSLVRFKDDNSATNLISSCPVLEDFDITTDEEKSFRTLNITSSSLKTFSLEYSVDGAKFDYVPKILIDAPALECINISDNVPNVYEVKDFYSLVKAEINLSNFSSPFSDKYCAVRTLELLNNIRNVKSLSISSCTMKTLLCVGRWNFPMFRNLTNLEFFGDDDEYWWKLVMAFLERSPALEVLIFKGFSLFPHAYGNRLNDVPSCLTSNLKTIKISGYPGRSKLDTVRYLLKNAKVLEKMIIRGTEAREVLTLPRGSSTCQIEIR